MKTFCRSISALTLLFALVGSTFADITLKQRVTMSGQKFESTKRIKGQRERTEQHMEMADPAMAAFMPQIATITQCDLKRRIQINDRKQLYFIEPFETPESEVLPGRPTTRPAQPAASTQTRKGGTMTMTYSVRDTNERKTMFGLQARHIIMTQEMETSPDSCSGPMKSKIEYDGWYVDFATDFSCPTSTPPTSPGRTPKPDCTDRIVMRGSGTAPKGMMIEGTMKMYGSDGTVMMTQTTETLELTRETLDPAIFDIPQGYALASSPQDLYKVTMPSSDPGPQSRPQPSRNTGIVPPAVSAKNIALNITMAPGTSGQSEIDSYLRAKLAERGFRVVPSNAEYALNVQVNQIKESAASKIGGIFGKVTGANTGGGKVDIDLSISLLGLASGNGKVKNKFDGPMSAAVRMALDQALEQALANANR
jgi:hypothetical protein